jgi:VWFA-related protein
VSVSRRTLLALALHRVWAQAPKFSVGVDVVTLLATVRDQDGLIVKNLNREDFVLLEDAVPQTIRYFSRESDLPLVIGLLVDTSQSQAHVLEPERRASYTFLDQVLREGSDQAFVAHFDVRVEVLEGFTEGSRLRAGTIECPPTLCPRCSTMRSGLF